MMSFDELWAEAEKKLWAAKTGPRDTSEHIKLVVREIYQRVEEIEKRVDAVETALSSVLSGPEPRKGEPA
jgi:hypothetical protein